VLASLKKKLRFAGDISAHVEACEDAPAVGSHPFKKFADQELDDVRGFCCGA